MARKAKVAALVTRESLQLMLDQAEGPRRQQIIGRALVALFNRQTEGEKAANDTEVYNDIGFSGADGKSGTLTAKYFLKHKKLEDWQVTNWMKRGRSGFSRICKYAKQLNEIAIAKAATAQQRLPGTD